MFIAAEIGEQLAEQAERLIHELTARVAEAAPRARVTWLSGSRLHVTIRFIGEVDEARVPAITAALERPLGAPPFDLALAGVGAFPAKGPPRALWAGIERGTVSLLAVEREIASRLSPLGLPREDRPYRPHLTLARVREAAGVRASQLLAGLERSSLGTCHIDAITLFESRLGPGGSRYTVLLKTALVAGGTGTREPNP